jgi:PTS system galactitol-specific IIA component
VPLFRWDLCWVGLDVENAEDALRTMARQLLKQGLVKDSFEEALLAREAASPTGLPLVGRKLAVPHADPEHVLEPAIACAVLARPLGFREMGNPGQELAVEVVALLALPDHESAQRELVRFIERCQDSTFLDRLCASRDAEALSAFLDAEVGA